jgi:hypothetical protein
MASRPLQYVNRTVPLVKDTRSSQPSPSGIQAPSASSRPSQRQRSTLKPHQQRKPSPKSQSKNETRVNTGKRSVKKLPNETQAQRHARTLEVAATMQDAEKAQQMVDAATRQKARSAKQNRNRKKKKADDARQAREMEK